MDGCDIGIYVLFDVEVKIFLLVFVEERVKCWFEENKKKGYDVNYEMFIEEIVRCDKFDLEREFFLLCKVEDVIEIDMMLFSIVEVVGKILEIVE